MASLNPLDEMDNSTTNPVHDDELRGSHGQSETRGSATKRLGDGAPKNTGSWMEYIMSQIDPTPGKASFQGGLTSAQRCMFSSLKASGGVMIIGYYAIFVGTVFWTIVELFFIEAVRTNKPYKLLKQEGLAWLIIGALLLGFGFVFTSFVTRRINKLTEDDLKLFKATPPVSTPEQLEAATKNRADAHKMIEEMDLPIDEEVYEDIMERYMCFFEDPVFILPDEMKVIFTRSVVFHKKPYPFLLVILCQIVLCTAIGLFSYGHGSAGSTIVCVFYAIYLVVSHEYLPISVSCKDTPLTILDTLDDGEYSLPAVAIGFQCFVIAEAFSVASESPLMNFEHGLVMIVTLMVKVASVCVALLAPNASTAAGTLVTFEFIAQLDDHFIANEAKYLKKEDFKNISPRPLFHDDYLAVVMEIVLIVTAGSAITNCIVGLSFP